MKKVLPLILALICVFLLIACNNDGKVIENNDIFHVGLNAKIVDIDTEKQIIYVKDCNNYDHYFAKKSAIDCSNLRENKSFIYVDYDTKNLMFIDIFDLKVGDNIIVSVYDDQLESSSNGYIVPEQIQLSTQRDK